MKKFKGTVNGQSFDNEKDFNEAADKAIKENDGTLSISSYYSYENEDEDKKEKLPETKKEDKKLPDYPVEETEYVLVNQKPFVNVDGAYEYNISKELEDKLHKATNKDEIKKKCNSIKSSLGEEIKKDSDSVKSLETEIEKLQDELYAKEDSIKRMKASKRYFNTIIDIVNGKEEKHLLENRSSYLPIVLGFGFNNIFDDFFKF